MVFNSVGFLIFFLCVLALSRFTESRHRKVMLLASSWFFYATWSAPFLLLLIYSSIVDFYCGKVLSRTSNQRKRSILLLISLCSNLGPLLFFKYFLFAYETVSSVLNICVGYSLPEYSFNIILPLGISFYTFQTLSYTVDIYHKKEHVVDSRIDFSLYVAFFPQLIAGPIVRAHEFVPQLKDMRQPEEKDLWSGLELIMIGLIKKVVIADMMAQLVEPVYASPNQYAGWALLSATFAFGLQIYGDFSGYTDIARGCGRLLGFELPRNFDKPLFAASPVDFWRRWHMTLTTIIRDFIYIPLGGNRVNPRRRQFNLVFAMTLCGLWHGAAMTFIIWGFYHGVGLILSHTLEGKAQKLIGERLATAAGILFTTMLVNIGWVFFRAKDLPTAIEIFQRMLLSFTAGQGVHVIWPLVVVISYLLFLLTPRKYEYHILNRIPLLGRTFIITIWLFFVVIFQAKSSEFIYFVF